MNPDCPQILQVLNGWLQSRLPAAAWDWVVDRQQIIATGDKRGMYLAFGMVPRKVGKGDLSLTTAELQAATQARRDWNPAHWSIDQAARVVFVLSYPSTDAAAYVATLDQLFGTGEVGELVALYQALPLLPHPALHVLRAAEGIRTNIPSVFCAVAHHNPFPAEQFNDDQWNQMILKCQFIGVPLAPVVGFEQRLNARLTAMVLDFIEERRAAKRTVAPDLWRCVGKFATPQAVTLIQPVLETGTNSDRIAAALALHESPLKEAKALLATVPALAEQVTSGHVTWDTLEHPAVTEAVR